MANKPKRIVVAGKSTTGASGPRPPAKKGRSRPAARRISPLAWVIGAAAVLVIALIAANNLGTGTTNREGITGNAKTLGPADAPVVVTEFSNFR